MSDDAPKVNARPEASKKEKQPFQIARDLRGGVPKELAERNRRQNAIRRKIIASLKEGAKTAPELAGVIELSAGETFWWLMALKKYGFIVEGPASGGYVKYRLKEEGGEEEK